MTMEKEKELEELIEKNMELKPVGEKIIEISRDEELQGIYDRQEHERMVRNSIMATKLEDSYHKGVNKGAAKKNLENARIQELIDLLGSKRKIFIRNLIAGISKGLGFGIGFYLITALLIYLLQYIVKLNIPIIGKYISDIVDIVELNRK